MTMRDGSRRLLPWFAALMIAAAGAAQAQQSNAPPNALQGFSQNRNQPVNIKAASLEVHDRDKMATFSGNVHLVQGDTTLRCKTLVVYYDADQTTGGPAVKSAAPGPTGSSQISKMKAMGGVIVTQKDQTAAGDSAIYDMKTNSVTLIAPAGGYVAVTQGPNVARGPRLVVHLDTGVSHFEGGVEVLMIPNSTKRDNQPAPANDPKAAPAHQPPKPKSNQPSSLY
jgi:lipopolysaccharide export system protein LptA